MGYQVWWLGYSRKAGVTMVLTTLLADNRYHLTGSRFFGGAIIGADWDFLTDIHGETQLASLGFVVDKSNTYKGFKPCRVYFYSPENIHVIVVEYGLDVYLKVRNHIYVSMLLFYHKLDRKERSVLWNSLIALVD